MGHIPADDLAVVVPDWIHPSEKPPIASIDVAQAQLHRIGGLSAGEIVPVPPVVRMNDFTVILPPLFKSEACVIKRGAVGIETLEHGSEHDDEFRGEVQRLPEFALALAQFSCEDLLLCDINAGPDEPLKNPAICRRCADAPDVTDRPVRTHDPLRKVESATLRQHRLNLLRDKISVV